MKDLFNSLAGKEIKFNSVSFNGFLASIDFNIELNSEEEVFFPWLVYYIQERVDIKCYPDKEVKGKLTLILEGKNFTTEEEFKEYIKDSISKSLLRLQVKINTSNP